MKAKLGSHVIGLAQTGFSDVPSGSGTIQKVTNKQGKTSQLHLGYVRLSIVITVNNTEVDNAQLNGLQRVAKSLTGHQSSTFRVVLSLLVAVVVILILITLILHTKSL